MSFKALRYLPGTYIAYSNIETGHFLNKNHVHYGRSNFEKLHFPCPQQKLQFNFKNTVEHVSNKIEIHFNDKL